MVNVPFITTFVEDYRFAVQITPLFRSQQVGMLDALMGYPWLAMVIRGSAIMQGTQMLVKITFLYNFEKAIPVLHFFCRHKIIFISQRPPNISECRKPSHNIAKIEIVCL